jgi:hypothetical protein
VGDDIKPLPRLKRSTEEQIKLIFKIYVTVVGFSKWTGIFVFFKALLLAETRPVSYWVNGILSLGKAN